MKKLIITLLVLSTLVQAKNIIVCTPGDGCKPVFIYGDDD